MAGRFPRDGRSACRGREPKLATPSGAEIRDQAETIATPNGVAPAGKAACDELSFLREPPLTANPLTDAIPASTTYRCVPEVSRRASSARTLPLPLHGVLPISDSVPFALIRQLEIVV